MNTPKTTFEVKDLALVQAIIEAGGVAKAGERLSLSQSAVSHHLRRLETKLGVALFRRAGRRLEPTSAGRRVASLSRDIHRQLASVERELTGRANQRVRLSTECYTLYHWLPGLLRDIKQTLPEIDVAIVVEATRDPLAALLRGDLDLAICQRPPAPGDRWAVTPLFEDPLVMVMAPDHPLTRLEQLTPADLSDQTLFVGETAPSELRRWGQQLFGSGPGPARVQKVPLTDAILELVKAGQGVSLMSLWIMRSYLSRGELTHRPMAGVSLERRWSAVTVADSPLSPATDALIEGLISARG